MAFPKTASLETPILQELVAVGGAEDVRFLYERLTAYFPQLDESEIQSIRNNTAALWRKLVQRAGRELDENNFIRRERGIWTLTEKGRRIAESESQGFFIARAAEPAERELNHGEIQRLLCEIGEILGFFAQPEFEYYDAVWRESERSPRLSHVFEVQSKGNIDSAFAKLKRAYVAQRSKTYLVLASERDQNRARQSLAREFHELEAVIKILTFPQIEQLHRSLQASDEILRDFLLK